MALHYGVLAWDQASAIWRKVGGRATPRAESARVAAGRGQLERLLRSGARFAEKAIVLDALDRGEATTISTRRIGPGFSR